jgi:CRP-like cAMP-binding protein
MVYAKVLKELALFEGLNDTELAKIAGICHERTFDDGAMCFVQGREAVELHLCRNGKVDIQVRVYEPLGITVIVHTAKVGEIFGWSALVKPCIYTASAKCVGKVEEIYIRSQDLVHLFEENPRIGYTVMRNLSTSISSRLTETREKLTKEVAAAASREW